MPKRTYITIHEINEDAVKARRTLEDWVTYLEDESGSFDGEATWDSVMEAIVLEFIMSGDFTELVTEKISTFASLPNWLKIAD